MTNVPVDNLGVYLREDAEVHVYREVPHAQSLQQVREEAGPAPRVVHHKRQRDDLRHLVLQETLVLPLTLRFNQLCYI